MKFVALILAALITLSAVACASEPSTSLPTSSPTPDIDATVEAGIRATQEVQAVIDATVQAEVAAILTAPQPTATPWPTATPSPTATPFPTPIVASLLATRVAPQPTHTPQPTLTPRPTFTPRPTLTPQPRPTLSPEQMASLSFHAARLAGGPGAIYVGNLNQLVGPAPTTEEGDAEGNVPLDALEKHRFVYESDYYRSLIYRAKLTNPTEMTYTGDPIIIQNVCVNRAIVFCKIVDSFMVPRLAERTNGKLIIESTSFLELGIAGPDTLALVRDGTLDMVIVLGPYVAEDLPQLEIQYLFGLYADRSQAFEATVAMLADIEQLLIDVTGGYPINVNWHNGNDSFLFTMEPMKMPEDFKGVKTRASLVHGISTYDWISGMGGDPQFLAFAEVYTALERGILEAGVTGGDAGHGQHWYEVTDYINGPHTSWPVSYNIINKEVWESIPADLQEILKEEAAKMELEALRLGAIQNELGGVVKLVWSKGT